MRPMRSATRVSAGDVVEAHVVLSVAGDGQLLLERDAGRGRVDDRDDDVVVVARQHEQLVGSARERDVALGAGEPCRPSTRVLMPRSVKPLPGSSHATDRTVSPVAIAGSRLSCAEPVEDSGGEHTRDEVRARDDRPAELFVDDRRVEDRHPAAAAVLGDREAVQAELAERRPQGRRVADRVVLQLAYDVDAAVPLARSSYRLAQQLLLRGEVKIHRVSIPRPGGARGCRRELSVRRRAPCRSCRGDRRRAAATSRPTQPQPSSSTSVLVTVPVMVIVSPGKTESPMRNAEPAEPRRADRSSR